MPLSSAATSVNHHTQLSQDQPLLPSRLDEKSATDRRKILIYYHVQGSQFHISIVWTLISIVLSLLSQNLSSWSVLHITSIRKLLDWETKVHPHQATKTGIASIETFLHLQLPVNNQYKNHPYMFISYDGMTLTRNVKLEWFLVNSGWYFILESKPCTW